MSKSLYMLAKKIPGMIRSFNYKIRYTHATPGSAIYSSAVGAPATHPNEKEITGLVSGDSNVILWIEEDLDFTKAISRRLGVFPDLVVCLIKSLFDSVSTAVAKIDAVYLIWSHEGHL